VSAIVLEHLSRSYGETAAVRDLSIEFADGKFVTLLGASGCGKTTTLRLIAGFLRPDAGTIRVGSKVLSSVNGIVPPERRGMGMVFQSYALWPHKTVRDNVAFGLEVRKRPRSEVDQRVRATLEMLDIAALERRYPSELSGGQQQRVALARSLVVEPGILLLDEPLSNLDAKLRERMRWELKSLQRRIGITFVYVTHDQAEAMALSDRIAVLHLGALQQYGPPREVYGRPENRTVADFMGLVNLVTARVLRRDGAAGDLALGGGAAAPLLHAPLPDDARVGDTRDLAIRPESVRLFGAPDGPGSFRAEVAEATFLGNLNDYQVTCAPLRLRVQAHAQEVFEVGQPVYVRIDAERCVVVRS
jgi:iron(III) transport system ATP-binding protein